MIKAFISNSLILIYLVTVLSADEPHPLNFEMPNGEKLVEGTSPFLADPCAIPSTLIDGRVNALTGTLIEVAQDIVVPGALPLTLERIYGFAIDKGSLAYGWDHNHAEVLASQWGKRHCYLVTKGKGGQLVFASRDYEAKQKLHPDLVDKGLTNCRGEISGKTNLKNYRIQKYSDIGRSLTTGAGTVSKFVKHHKYYYLRDLVTDKLQRYVYTYGADQGRMVSQLDAENSKGVKWGGFKFSYPTARELKDFAHGKSKEAPCIQVQSEDGRYASYELKPYVKSDFSGEELIRFVIKQVDSSENPPVKFEYQKLYDVVDESLTAIKWPEKRYLLIEYDPILLDLKDPPRVRALYAPLGKNEEPVKLYSFEYKNLPYPDGTIVQDALNHQTIYHYSKDSHRLKSIEKYTGNKKYNLYSVEKYQWGKGQDKGNLICRSVEDEEGRLKKSQTFTYDLFGNVIQEELTGRLKGKDKDTYVKTMTYDTAGGYNNKLSSEDFAVRYEYVYAPGTSLCTARYTIDQIIKKREFFAYDPSGAIIEEISDDGSGQKKEDWKGVTERRYTAYVNLNNGLPSVIEEGYFDLNNHMKVPLKKTIKTYDSLSRLIQEDIHEKNHVYTWHWEYNRLGLITKETNPLGDVTTRSYDRNGNIISETDPIISQEFQYDCSNRLIKTVKGSQVEQFEYDFMGQKIASTDVHGNTTFYKYDELGRLIEITYPDKHVEKYTYDIFGIITSKTTPKGDITSYKNTLYGKPYEKILPNGEKELYEYDLKGNLSKYVAVDGSSTLYTYDYASRPLTIEIFDKQGNNVARTVKKYNAFHLIEEIDPAQHVTRYTYDGGGRLIKEQCEDQITEYGYDGFGRRTYIRKFASSTDYVDEFLQYDLLDRVLNRKVADSEGKIELEELFEYDFYGNKTRHVRGGIEERFTYDSYSRLIQRTDGEGNITQFLHDDILHMITEIDPMGNRIVRIHDARGRVIKSVRLDAEGKQLTATLFEYDPNGNKIKQVDEQITTQWEYDSCDRMIATVEACGTKQEKKTAYAYLEGRLHTITKPSGIVLTYIHDCLGRLKELFSSDSSIHAIYNYQIAYHPSLTVFDRVQLTETKRIYDQNNWLVEETLANRLTLQYAYDLMGRQTTLTLPDRSTIQTAYKGSHVKEVHRFGATGEQGYIYSSLSYTPTGKLAQAQLPCGTLLTHRYDSCDRLLETLTPEWHEKTIAYDPCGNLVQKGDVRFSYDDLSQLSSEVSLSFENKFKNDPFSNHLAVNEKKQTFNPLHQLLPHPYDKNGNLTQLAHCYLEYDALDRLIQVNTPTEQIAYTYDPFNRRLTKNSSEGSFQKFLYAKGQEIGSTDALDNIKELKVMAHAETAFAPPIALELSNTVYTPLTDLQGNIAALLDSQGTLVERYSFSAFGEETPSAINSSTVISPWRFSSKRHDPETSLIYFGERYYSPLLRRWITPDPLGLIDGINTYAYLHNNPFKYRDADGRFAQALVFVPFVVSWGVKFTAATVLQLVIDFGACATAIYFQMNNSAEVTEGSPSTIEAPPQKKPRDKKKYYEENFPGTDEDIANNPDWVETTHPNARKHGHRQFENTKTGETLNYDKGKPNENGHKRYDHYHRGNKNYQDQYYDHQGNLMAEGEGPTHLSPPEGTTWSF